MLEEARQPPPWPAGDTGASGQPVAVPRAIEIRGIVPSTDDLAGSCTTLFRGVRIGLSA